MSSVASTKLAVTLRIAVVQLNPQIGQVKQTIARTWELLNKFKQNSKPPDIVVFPEFALTGYNFHSRDQILPYCTLANVGPTYDLACKVSQTFQCYTVIGYPEKTTEDDRLYNAAVVVDPKGQLVFNYRKSFLYETDEEWGCNENPRGFQTFPLTFKNNARDTNGNLQEVTLKTSIGICMDLSPYKFKAPFHDCEFATYNLDQATELIICPMAWLHSISAIAGNDNEKDVRLALHTIERSCEREHVPLEGSRGEFELNVSENATVRLSRSDEGNRMAYAELDKPDMSNVNYWLLRFLPFLFLEERKEWSPQALSKVIPGGRLPRNSYIGATRSGNWAFMNRSAVLAIANRCGIEEAKTVFAGSSGIYKFNGKECEGHDAMDSTNNSVELRGNLGKGREGILCRDVQFEVVR
ncbi:related to Protein N-terminal amidase [Zygosaccharomyces bailii ISA1307]|nr:related to Protein N-terminal amidase [Zygosaccharomyces bailii ISA1307]